MLGVGLSTILGVSNWQTDAAVEHRNLVRMQDFVADLFVRKQGATSRRRRFSFVVSAPELRGDDDFKCAVSSPLTRKPIDIWSSTPDHASFLAFRFIRQMLEYEGLELVDAKGDPVELPYPPGCDQDLRSR